MAAFAAAAGLPGWAVLGRWRFASVVTGGSLMAANATSPLLSDRHAAFHASQEPVTRRASRRREREVPV